MTPIQNTAAAYLEAAGGDSDEALRLAVADLLRLDEEQALTVAALDQWTSRGSMREGEREYRRHPRARVTAHG